MLTTYPVHCLLCWIGDEHSLYCSQMVTVTYSLFYSNEVVTAVAYCLLFWNGDCRLLSFLPFRNGDCMQPNLLYYAEMVVVAWSFIVLNGDRILLSFLLCWNGECIAYTLYRLCSNGNYSLWRKYTLFFTLQKLWLAYFLLCWNGDCIPLSSLLEWQTDRQTDRQHLRKRETARRAGRETDR